MRDLHKTLKLCATEFAMDYCVEFNEVKSVLEYCHKHVKPFNKLHFRSGNESFITELARRLQDMMVDRKLVHAETKAPLSEAKTVLRKINMFLMLNTDATYKYNLREDANIAHVIELCPLMPKFLLVALVWELQLDSFFYEALSYMPCWFAFQYFETAVDSLKYINDPYAVLEKVEQLVTAIFVSMTRSEHREIDNIDKKIIFGKLYDCTMDLLRQFYTPDAEKFKQFKKNQFFRYSGFALKHILQMLLFTFDVYEAAAKAEPIEDVSIYEICLQLCKVVTQPAQESTQLKEHQLRIINALLNSLQYNVMLVKIDVFMYWVEVDLSPSENLQMSIGEMSYKVGERMLANPVFAHDVDQQLKMIAIRPKTLEETIRDATIGDILRTLQDQLPYNIKKAWFAELFNRPITFGNDECVQVFKDNMKLIDVQQCQQMFDFIKMEIICDRDNQNIGEQKDIKCNDLIAMDVDTDDYEELSSLILYALRNFSNEQILQLLNYQVKIFGNATNICRQTTIDFAQRATEFLNKYNSSELFDLQQFLILCFENPTLMWMKFFDCACHNSSHVSNFCATVKQTRPFSNYYFNMMLNEAMSDTQHKIKDKFFPQLLCEIYFVLYYPERKTEYLKQFINNYVNMFLDAQQYDALLPIIKALNLIETYNETQSHKPHNFGEITAPVLLMAAQVMDKSRWDLITYTNERDDIVRECIQFIQRASKKFLPVATEKDRKWITKVINDSYRPTTQYYFQKFALTPNQPAVDFDRFLIRLEIEDKSEAEMFLIINYVRCTMKETEWLARSERLLPHISNVMIILGGVVAETENPNAINSYRHCVANYANIVTKFLLPEIENDTKKVEKLEIKLLKIIEAAPEEVYEETFMNFECLLLEVIKKCKLPMSDEVVKTVQKHISKMKDCRAKGIFEEKFQALVTECMTLV